MLKYTTQKVISVQDWDNIVQKIYGKPYSFQQQDGCKDRGVFHLTVPDKGAYDFENNTLPEIVNGPEMGVSFSAWKKRDPKTPVGELTREWEINMYWERNFYPNIEMIANDLYENGHIEAGEYMIEIDW